MKICTCKMVYDIKAWEALSLIGVWYEEIAGEQPISLEYRNCVRCRSTLNREIEPKVAKCLMLLQKGVEGHLPSAMAAAKMQKFFALSVWKKLVAQSVVLAKLHTDMRAIRFMNNRGGEA